MKQPSNSRGKEGIDPPYVFERVIVLYSVPMYKGYMVIWPTIYRPWNWSPTYITGFKTVNGTYSTVLSGMANVIQGVFQYIEIISISLACIVFIVLAHGEFSMQG